MGLYSALGLEWGILDPHPLLLTSSASQATHAAAEVARPENSSALKGKLNLYFMTTKQEKGRRCIFNICIL